MMRNGRHVFSVKRRRCHGKRFLMVKPVDQGQAQAAAEQINVVQYWFEELKRRVPVGAK
jgi:hypothetical protein